MLARLIHWARLINWDSAAAESDSALKLQELLGGGRTAQLTVQDAVAGSTAGSLLQAASDLVSANPDIPVTILDHSTLKDCQLPSCLSGHLSKAAHRCGGKLHPADGAQQHPPSSTRGDFSGHLELPGLKNPIPLSSAAARLFGLELAGLQGAAQQTVDQLAQQQQGEELLGSNQEGLAVYESTLVSLPGLQHQYGEASEEAAAAESTLVTLLGEVLLQLQEAYNKDILFSVTLLPELPVSSGNPYHLLSWKEMSRRLLLERSGVSSQQLSVEPADSKAFASKATAYAVALILIWFTFAGTYCMVSMKFKQAAWDLMPRFAPIEGPPSSFGKSRGSGFNSGVFGGSSLELSVLGSRPKED
eukprot:gene6828-7045_t